MIKDDPFHIHWGSSVQICIDLNSFQKKISIAILFIQNVFVHIIQSFYCWSSTRRHPCSFIVYNLQLRLSNNKWKNCCHSHRRSSNNTSFWTHMHTTTLNLNHVFISKNMVAKMKDNLAKYTWNLPVENKHYLGIFHFT